MRNTLLVLILIFTVQITQSATFVTHNLSGRDIFLQVLWVDKKSQSHIYLPNGKRMSFNSEVKDVQMIKWIADVPNDNKWKQYKIEGRDGDSLLSALKVGKELRIYANGSYENNFKLNFAGYDIRKAEEEKSLPGEIYIEGYFAGIPLEQLLVVENVTKGTVLVRPFGDTALLGHFLVSGNYDCIVPGGSKVYFVYGSGAQLIEYMQDVLAGTLQSKWYVLQYKPTGMPNNSLGLVGGKVQILGDGILNYKFSSNGVVMRYDQPVHKQIIVAPRACEYINR